jgi:hypothetical protein
MTVESVSKVKILLALLDDSTCTNVYLIQDQHLIMTKVRLFLGQIFRGKFFFQGFRSSTYNGP